MPIRRAPYYFHNTAPALPPKPVKAEPKPYVPPDPPAYHTAPAWTDTAKRVRTWGLHDPDGVKIAEVTTKRAASQLADLLNCKGGDTLLSSPSPSP